MLRVVVMEAFPATSSVPSEVAPLSPSANRRPALNCQFLRYPTTSTLPDARLSFNVIARQLSGSGKSTASHQHSFCIYGAPPVCRAVISRHPAAAPMYLLASSRSLLKLARKRQNSPVNSPNVRRSRYGDTHFAPGYVLDRIVPTPFPAQASQGIRDPTTVSRPEHETSRACPEAHPGLRPRRAPVHLVGSVGSADSRGAPGARLSRLR